MQLSGILFEVVCQAIFVRLGPMMWLCLDRSWLSRGDLGAMWAFENIHHACQKLWFRLMLSRKYEFWLLPRSHVRFEVSFGAFQGYFLDGVVIFKSLRLMLWPCLDRSWPLWGDLGVMWTFENSQHAFQKLLFRLRLSRKYEFWLLPWFHALFDVSFEAFQGYFFDGLVIFERPGLMLWPCLDRSWPLWGDLGAIWTFEKIYHACQKLWFRLRLPCK